jgi:hypothetical protein
MRKMEQPFGSPVAKPVCGPDYLLLIVKLNIYNFKLYMSKSIATINENVPKLEASNCGRIEALKCKQS